MMESPEFKKQMKKLAESKEFKDGAQKTGEYQRRQDRFWKLLFLTIYLADALKDPSTAARLEAKMEHMLKVGEEQLTKGAGAAMEQAMADMANPEVMAEMAKMLKDPQFQAQIAAMTKDPSFKNYVSAVSQTR